MSRNIKEPMKNFLDTSDNKPVKDILPGLQKKFNLTDSQAIEVYKRWKNNYMQFGYRVKNHAGEGFRR